MSTDRDGYVAGLRALADALDAHPDIPLPSEGSLWEMSIPFHGHAHEDDRVGAMAAAARVLMPGRRDKAPDENGYFRIRGALHGLKLDIWAMREQVCGRVVIGTREVTREVVVPVETRTETVTETVDEVRWECRPLLAAEAEQVPA
jgi:hypothetical protein